MSENTDALERGYEAFNKGDIDTVRELFADDIRWEGPATEGLPMAGVTEGQDEVLQGLGQFNEAFEKFTVIPDEMIEQGETVVVLSHVEAKSRSGNDLKTPGAEVWRMSGGKAKRVQTLGDTLELKKAIDS